MAVVSQGNYCRCPLYWNHQLTGYPSSGTKKPKGLNGKSWATRSCHYYQTTSIWILCHLE